MGQHSLHFPLTSAGCETSEELPSSSPGLNLSLGLLSPGLLGTDLDMPATPLPSLATTGESEWGPESAGEETQCLHNERSMQRNNIMRVSNIF